MKRQWRWIWLAGLLSVSVQVFAEPTLKPPTVGPLSTASLLQTLMGLGVVLLFILLLAWFVRRSGTLSAATGGPLKILAGRSLGPRERLVLVQVGEEQLLIGVAPGRVQTLHVLREPISVESVNAGGFAERLGTAMKKGQGT
ncbi:MAG: flagellar biosynthetic protein FliO [Chromatiales bacterium]|nr:flagellar biosynthetic protein FliO [Chromatiales bacterium]